MRRPYRPVRQSASFKRQLEKDANRRKAIAIAGAATVVLSVFAFFALQPADAAVDKSTGCPADSRTPEAHTIVLIDGTDRLSANEIRYAEDLIRTEYLNLPIGSRLTVANITANTDVPSDLVICRMAERAERGDINANDAFVQRQFQKIVGVRLERLMEELADTPVQEFSPIRETLAVVAERPDFGSSIRLRRLIVLSDLAQHSDLASDYDGTFRASEDARDVFDRDMGEVAVRLHYVRRRSLRNIQGAEHKRAWIQAVRDMGPEDVVIGHDLNIGEPAGRVIWTRVR